MDPTQLDVAIADSMSENEEANKAVDHMFARAASGPTMLKTYMESDNYGTKGDHD